MIDFTTSLYLGFRHPSRSFPSWDHLTTGRPAALDPPPSGPVFREIARLIGVERAIAARSTLHGFIDVFGMFGHDALILVDGGTYPIAVTGTLGAADSGATVLRFRHHRPAHLASLIAGARTSGRRLVVVSDGWCPGCGGAAPLADYADLSSGQGGLLVIDDTQALGVLGRRPSATNSYGAGGGGSLMHHGLRGQIVLVSSLAKGFGVPLAVVGGPARVVDSIQEEGSSQTHASPPSTVDLLAAELALAGNRRVGDPRRQRLLALVRLFRHQALQAGTRPLGGDFPVQSVGPLSERAARALHRWLWRAGVATVLQRLRCQSGAAVTFVLTANHRARDVHVATWALRGALSAGVGHGAA